MSAFIWIGRIILNIIYSVMKLAPVRDKITLLSRQSDTLTRDFDLLIKAMKKISPDTEYVCLCRKTGEGVAGKLGYLFHVLLQMRHIATSKKIVVDSYSPAVSLLKQRKGAEVIQIWHALGVLKKFGRSIAGNGGEGRDGTLAELLGMHKNYTAIMVSTPLGIPAFAEAFGYDEDKLFVGSLPRVDLLTDPEYVKAEKERIIESCPEIREAKKEGRRIVLYAPTFRVERDISSGVKQLADAIYEMGGFLVVKKHPLMEIADYGKAFHEENFSTIEMMCAADVLICDYSAVVFEGALMNKPLVFYAYDYDEYKDRRDFYIDYEKEMPGPINRDPKEAARISMGNDFDMEKIAAFAEKYVTIRHNAAETLGRRICS